LKLLARFALAQQVPATVELDLELLETLVPSVVGTPSLGLVEKPLLLGDQGLDPITNARVVHVKTLAPSLPLGLWSAVADLRSTQPVFRNILVAIDSSPTAQRALDEAIDLAQALNARLTVICVAPEVPAYAYRAGVDAQKLEKEAESDTEKLLRAAADSVPEDMQVTTVLKHGHAGERIVEQIEGGDHDLVAMGSRGLGRVTSNLIGSTGAYVHFHSRVAMLVIHPDE
jgi:nucleotide-binding universal stress UspA family protein